MTTIYAEDYETKTELLPWQKRELMYTSTGYGKKIPTDRMIKYNNRWYRIYCCIFSNAGTCYISIKNGDIIVDN